MQINLLVIRTANPTILAKFYEQLGITFHYHQHGNGPFHYSAELEGLIFEIYPLLKNQDKPDTSLRLGFEVTHLEELILDLKQKKVEIVTPPTHAEWGYFAVIKDSDGRKIELKQQQD